MRRPRRPTVQIARLCTLSAALLFAGLIQAQEAPLRLHALEDFPVIDAGQVPYYREGSRDALAIDAAQVSYRDRFARAEHVFAGEQGVYDLVLETLGEIDGEGRYRIWIDGELVGDVDNAATDDDFAPQRFQIEDVTIFAGAVIAVESTATSNETIPENGEFAFARGRWRALELTPDATDVQAPADPVFDLQLGAPSSITLAANGSASLALRLSHASTSTDVATGVRVQIDVPEGLDVAAAGCSADSDDSRVLSCAMAELAPGEETSLSLRVAGSPGGEEPLRVSVSADQDDTAPEDNALAVQIEPGEQAETTDPVETPTATQASNPAPRKSSGAFSLWAVLALMSSFVARRRPRVRASR